MLRSAIDEIGEVAEAACVIARIVLIDLLISEARCLYNKNENEKDTEKR